MDVFARLGWRSERRPLPRLGTSIAGGGCAVALVGALVLSIDHVVSGNGDGASRAPGIVTFLAVVAGGYAIAWAANSGPLAVAGIAAATFGMIPLVALITWSNGDLPPFSLTIVLFATAAAAEISYLVGPGRGRTLVLGTVLVAAWLFVLEAFDPIVEFPIVGPVGAVSGLFGTEADQFSRAPNFTRVGVLSVLIGLVYLVVARALDRHRYAGAATAAIVAGLPALFLGVEALAGDLDQLGTGVVLVGCGFAVAYLGATAGRRVTTWVGGAAVALGAVILVTDAVNSSPTSVGAALLLTGAALIVVAQLVSHVASEPPEDSQTPSWPPRSAAPAVAEAVWPGPSPTAPPETSSPWAPVTSPPVLPPPVAPTPWTPAAPPSRRPDPPPAP